MGIQFQLTQQDGILNNSLKEIALTPADSIPFEYGKIVKAEIAGYNGGLITMNSYVTMKKYDASTNSWTNITNNTISDLTDVMGYNFILNMEAPSSNTLTVYFCKDDEITLIPDYLTSSLMRYRVNSHINTDTLFTYRGMKGTNTQPFIPLFPLCIFKAPTDSNTTPYVLGVEVQGNIADDKVRIKNFPIDDTVQVYSEAVTGKPSVFFEFKPSDTTVQDLESKVNILITRVDELDARVSTLESNFGNLRAVVAAALDTISTVYVAR